MFPQFFLPSDPRSRSCSRQSLRTLEPSGLPVESKQRFSPDPSGGRGDHMIGEARTTSAIAVGCAHNVVRCLEMKFLRCDKLLHNVGYFIPGKSIRSRKDP